MARETVVLITGAGRGIGRAIAEKYLLRPYHIVIGSVRDASAPRSEEIKRLSTAEGSRLHLVSIENTSLTDPKDAVKDIEAAGITHIDIVIANAGISPEPQGPDTVDVKDVIECFQINAVSPLSLYQAVKPLLEKSTKPVWLTASGAASIERLEVHNAQFVVAYGMSKAAVDFFTVAVHSSNPSLIAFAIHPGLVQTEMGNAGAHMMGMEKAPTTVDESSTKTISYVDNATRESTSGKFFSIVEGVQLPW